ncbi:NAD-dependent epimerase/dehydratase family protein [Patescibacteria group bacterium]|nr:NAD-dependent epimerase/dehydratase family protein [Patescibacteria group bacterium]
MKNILVTGGLGFIGSHIVDALCLQPEYNVAVIDEKHSKTIDCANPLANYCEVDITDARELKTVFWLLRPYCVIHCAALARLQPSFVRVEEYVNVNVLGTKNILEAAKYYKVKRIVYSSSSSVYTGHTQIPLKEDMMPLLHLLSPYGTTKLIGEMLMRDMGKMTGGPETVSLRYFNVYGPRQPEEGEYALVAGRFLKQWQNGEPLTMVPDGKQSRDFTWVMDVVQANILAMLSSKVGNAEIINIGSGKDYSVWDLADMIGGENYPKIFIPARKGEARKTLADISRAKKLFGWKPTVFLPEGITLLKKEMGL